MQQGSARAARYTSTSWNPMSKRKRRDDESPDLGLAGWLTLGLVTEAQVRAFEREYATGNDRHPEHYRYRAFRQYLNAHRPLPPEQAEAIYRLGEQDPDRAMGRAMMFEILDLPECPKSLGREALASGERSLVRLVRRKELLAELDAGLTDELFERCLREGDGVIQDALLARSGLSREQLSRLAEATTTRRVRNMAAAALRQRR
jgi:hypothetical protein